ncbi:hypothetical protein [Marinicauda salina]|nr:hypothetical protein [Marinicauda salina]
MKRRIAQIVIASAAIVTLSAGGSALWTAMGPAQPAAVETTDR